MSGTAATANVQPDTQKTGNRLAQYPDPPARAATLPRHAAVPSSRDPVFDRYSVAVLRA